ncbi:MAG TPA: hypothetical protein VFG68_04085 [Fimbriiglobus sp.]|nr:hypothetical protein [Fimbriiglobus sp.]
MTRIDVCAREDYETATRLLEVIAALGGRGTEDADELTLGTGVSRFHFGADEVTVFADAWGVDLAGPDKLVNDILAALKD